MKKILTLLIVIFISFGIGIDVKAIDEEIIGPDIIYKQYDKVLTMSTIKALYQAPEDIVVTYDEYTGYGDIPAIYDVTFSSGILEKEIQISVRQTLGNVIAVTFQDDAYMIHVYKNIILSQDDIIDILVRINYITVTSTTGIFSLTNTYSENASAPGTYVYEFMLATTSGFESTHTVSIKVSNTEELTPDIELQPVDVNIFAININSDLIIALALLIAVITIVYLKFKKKKGNKK